ncbi:putative powdery mildew resistance protein, RPW8 [Rosa chinensis]|uniref:Putative powdery mildew resistance protein, RPW8 n=1 Tax=Rosa chinensis TaxID=74649 RepID=A0A2P6P414_ROSCH|nr:putative powdery mildew resistance protein, RPW8 [Rosa chinensis]
MPAKLIGGPLYNQLFDGVKTATGRSTKFTSLLEDLKFTLVSLQPRINRQRGDQHDAEIHHLLPNEEIQDLERQMEEGVKLVAKLSSVGIWNYHCMKSNYSDQLAQLDRSLRKMLYILKLQEERDIMELLLVARTIRDRQNVLERRLCGLLKVQQEKTDGNGHVGSGGGGGAGRELEHVFCRLLESLVLEVYVQLNGKTRFSPVLADLKSTVRSFQPLMEEISDYNKLLHLPKEELDNLRKQLEKGIELVDKCSKVPQGASYKKYEYADELLELDDYLQRLLCMMREQVAKDLKETLVSVSNMEMMLTRIEEGSSGLAQN